MMTTTVKETCLVCQGTRWVADAKQLEKSVPCPYCDEKGLVEVSLPEGAQILSNPKAKNGRK